MTFPQRKTREIVFQALFYLNFYENGKDEQSGFVDLMQESAPISKKYLSEAFDEAMKIAGHKDSLEAEITKVSTEYNLERILLAERVILRLMIHEMLISKLPPAVAISEGVRLANKFATVHAASFVHAILDGVAKNHHLAVERLEVKQESHAHRKTCTAGC